MPIMQDDGCPVSPDTLASARSDLPREYGLRVVTERGRRVLVARVPRAKPDYNYELQHVSLYATLADLKDTRDVLLVGDEKVVRMDPVRLRDHVREQMREDQEVVQRLRTQLPRADEAWTVFQSPMNHAHWALACRLAVPRLEDATESNFARAKAAVGSQLVEVLRQVQYVYFVTDTDHGRVGRRLFVDALAPELATAVAAAGGKASNPIHFAFNAAGGTLKPSA